VIEMTIKKGWMTVILWSYNGLCELAIVMHRDKGLEKNAKKMIFHFIIFKRSSFFIVILNGAKWSEKSSYFQNGKISPLRCE